MADQTITIPVSGTTTVSAQLAQGTAISNLSTNQAIWVSSQPNVQVNNGIRIGALGSLQWNGGPCYAIVESGTTPIKVSLSSSVQQITNPVDVATALSQQGVPNVLTGNIITSIGNNQPFDVSGYASVSGTIDIPAAGYLTIQFFDPTFTVRIFEKTYQFAAAYSGWLFTIPVHGPQMNLAYNGSGGAGGALNITLYGSNRTLSPESISFHHVYNQRSGSLSATTYTLGPPVATNGGLSSFNIRTTPQAITAGAVIGYQYYDFSNFALPGQVNVMQLANTKQMPQDDAGNYSIFVEAVIPPGVIQPVVTLDTAATTTFVIQGMVP